jgi:hypothetical protein
VSGSRARKFWALALAPSNDLATTRVTVHFNAFLVFVQVHSERAKKCRRSAQFRFAPRCARCSACGDEARAGGSPRCRWGPALLFNTSPVPLRPLCQRRPEISSRAARMRIAVHDGRSRAHDRARGCRRWAGTQGPSPHAAARLRLRPRQQGPRHPGDPGLARASPPSTPRWRRTGSRTFGGTELRNGELVAVRSLQKIAGGESRDGATARRRRACHR